jgi:hypothetical protein
MTAPQPADHRGSSAPTDGPDPLPENWQVLRRRRPAGHVVLLVVVGLCVVSLFRTPNPIRTVVTAARATAIVGLLVWDARHRTAGGARR